MPNTSRTRNKKPETKNQKNAIKIKSLLFKIYGSRLTSGFSLVEIVLASFLLMIFLSILLIGSGTFLTTRRYALQNVAAQIASNRIDYLRNLAKTNFASITTQSFTNPELQKLPGSSGTQTVNNYLGQSDIKQVTINVDWTENSKTRSTKFETFIYQFGVN